MVSYVHNVWNREEPMKYGALFPISILFTYGNYLNTDIAVFGVVDPMLVLPLLYVNKKILY